MRAGKRAGVRKVSSPCWCRPSRMVGVLVNMHFGVPEAFAALRLRACAKALDMPIETYCVHPCGPCMCQSRCSSSKLCQGSSSCAPPRASLPSTSALRQSTRSTCPTPSSTDNSANSLKRTASYHTSFISLGFRAINRLSSALVNRINGSTSTTTPQPRCGATASRASGPMSK